MTHPAIPEPCTNPECCWPTAQPEPTSLAIFADGKHKHGGTIYAIHPASGRIHLGVVKPMPKTWLVKHPGERYLVNDWTIPSFIDGERNPERTHHYPTRGEAMAKIADIAARAQRVGVAR